MAPAGDLGAAGHHLGDEILPEPQLERQRPLGGALDPGLEIGEFGGGIIANLLSRLRAP
jgi:hypothetical protein